MKRAFLLVAVLVGGVATGGGSAWGVHHWQGPSAMAAERVPQETEDTVFVPAGPLLTPLVLADGSLAGYASIEVQLEVAAGGAEEVKQRLPLLLHAINLHTYRTPLAAGPDGTLADLPAFRRLVAAAAPKTFGPGRVRRIAITQVRPA